MNRPEEALQRALVSFLRLALPKGWIVHHSANGGYRTPVEASRFRAMGVVAGFPDLMLIGQRMVIFMELKAPPKRLKSGALSQEVAPLSAAQRDVLDALGQADFPTVVVRSIDDAVFALEQLGVPLSGKARQ